MKNSIALVVLFCLCIMIQARQQEPIIDFGERVIADYSTCYTSYSIGVRRPSIQCWLEDSDTKNIMTNFVGSQVSDSLSDTIFVLRSFNSGWGGGVHCLW